MARRKEQIDFIKLVTIMGALKFIVQVERPGGKFATIMTAPKKKSTPANGELMDMWENGDHEEVIDHLNAIMRNHYLKYVG